MSWSWFVRGMAHALLVLCMTYHASEIDSYVQPYSRGLYDELWHLLNGGEIRDAYSDLFTIQDTRSHIHQVLSNYFELPARALGHLRVASAVHDEGNFICSEIILRMKNIMR
jgi:hypothetical protein